MKKEQDEFKDSKHKGNQMYEYDINILNWPKELEKKH